MGRETLVAKPLVDQYPSLIPRGLRATNLVLGRFFAFPTLFFGGVSRATFVEKGWS